MVVLLVCSLLKLKNLDKNLLIWIISEVIDFRMLHLQDHIAAQLADRSNIEKYLTTVQTLYMK